MNSGLNALAVVKVEFGRGGGLLELIIVLAVAGSLVWALTRPGAGNAAKRANAAELQAEADGESAND